MTTWSRFLGLGAGLTMALCQACTPASGALGPQGYEQSLSKIQVKYSDPAQQKFLPAGWVLDNYAYDPVKKTWSEKKGVQYRAIRRLDEDADGTVSRSERHGENIFDLRFVNTRDNAVIWLKVHPLEPTAAGRDLDVILENYADGLEGTGLFEQSTLFGLSTDKGRHFTTFMVRKEPTTVGPLPAIRGVIEIADVEKLRLDPAHRDSKAELVFAKVAYTQKVSGAPKAPLWPVISTTSAPASSTGAPASVETIYRRTGLLVIGYYDDAARFESHLADLHGLLGQLVVPPSAVPPDATPYRAPASAAVAMPPAPAPAPAPAPTTPASAMTPTAAPAATTPAATTPPATTPPATAPAATTPAGTTPAPAATPASKATPPPAVVTQPAATK